MPNWVSLIILSFCFHPRLWKGSTDLALIAGSVSAGILFLMVVSLLGFAVHRHSESYFSCS